MQLIIGSNPSSLAFHVPIWVALSWIAIIFYTPDFLARYLSTCILGLIWILQAECHDIVEDYFERMKPENVLRATLLTFKPAFDGKETEQNWSLREKHIIKMRQMCFELTPTTEPMFVKTVKEMLDDLLKTVNSLRTTVSTNGCLFFQDLAKECGPSMDNMIDILLQNFIKLSANTKPIARTNANETIVAIVRHCHYRLSIVQHISNACKDKNVQPRRFACEWLNKVIKHNVSATIEHHGGLDLIEASIKLGLEDKDKEVREAMRPTYWNFARRWPKRSEALFSSLDKTKQDQLLADPSNPNPQAPPSPSKVNSSVKLSRSAGPAPPKSSLKDFKAKLAAAKTTQPLAESLNSSADKVQNETVAPKDDPVPTAPASKPNLKEIKARMVAQKLAQSQAESSLASADKIQSEAPTSKPDTHSAAPLPKAPFSEAKVQLPIQAAPLLKAPLSEVKVQLPIQAAMQKSGEGSHPSTETAPNEASISKNGTISAAPLRRKKSRHPGRGKSKQREAENPQNDASAPQIATDEVKNEAPIAPAITSTPDNEATVLPNATAFVDHALTRISQRSLDQHGFRKLQVHLREGTQNAAYEILIEPLCAWIETPTSTVSSSEWQDVQAQALATLRLILTNPLWASKHYPRILASLIAANQFYTAQGPMVVGIKKNLTFVINHCNLLVCLRSVSDLMEKPHHDTVEETGLMTLGAMLHRIHEDDAQEGVFYKRLLDEQALVQRLGQIGSNGLHSKEISVRKAAIKFAQEFWHTIPKEDYFVVIAGDNVETQDLLQYYIARHLKIDDHIEFL